MLSSTMGRAGTNVLSHVKCADKIEEPVEILLSQSVNKVETTTLRNIHSLFDDDNPTHERLPFPKLSDLPSQQSKQDVPGNISLDSSHIAPVLQKSERTMFYSKSQHLDIVESDLPSPSFSPRRSPRRSPRSEATPNTVIYKANTVVTESKLTDQHIQQNSNPNILNKHNTTANTPNIPPAPAYPKPTNPNEDLLAQLEILKIQNKLLNTRIQRAQEESHEQLENERIQRIAAVTELTNRNIQLSDELNISQLQAQQLLSQEKEAFLIAMKRMQQERDDLNKRVQQIQELAENEIKLARMQKTQLTETMTELEQEKSRLLQSLAEHSNMIKQLQVEQIEIPGMVTMCSTGRSPRLNSAGKRKSRSYSISGSTSGSNGGSSNIPVTDTAGIGTSGSSSISIQHSPVIETDNHNSSSTTSSSSQRWMQMNSNLNYCDTSTTFPTNTIFQFTHRDNKLALLQAEVSRMTQSLEKLTQQKLVLDATLQDTEATAHQNHTQLAQQLQDEKERLELRVQKMCVDQDTMRLRLTQAEETVQKQNILAQQQQLHDNQERSAAEAALTSMQTEQKILLARISEAKKKSFASKEGSKSLRYLDGGDIPEDDTQQQQDDLLQHALCINTEEDVMSSTDQIVSATDKSAALQGSRQASSTALVQVPDAPLGSPMMSPNQQAELDRKLAEMLTAMSDLKAQLTLKDVQAREREKAMQEQNAHEKEELKRAVQRMREDLIAERQQQEQQYYHTDQAYNEHDYTQYGYEYSGEGYTTDAYQQQEGHTWDGTQDDSYDDSWGPSWHGEEGQDHSGGAEGYDTYQHHQQQQHYENSPYSEHHEHTEYTHAAGDGDGTTDQYHYDETGHSAEGQYQTDYLAIADAAAAAVAAVDNAAVSGDSAVVTATTNTTTTGGTGPGLHSVLARISSRTSVKGGGRPGLLSTLGSSYSLHSGSRSQSRSQSIGCPSAAPAALVSHKSLFDLLSADYKPSSAVNLNAQLLISAAKAKHAEAAAVATVATVSAITTVPETITPSTTLTQPQLSEGQSNPTNPVTSTDRADPVRIKLGALPKGKTIMDLDSDSDEDTWSVKQSDTTPTTTVSAPVPAVVEPLSVAHTEPSPTSTQTSQAPPQQQQPPASTSVPTSAPAPVMVPSSSSNTTTIAAELKEKLATTSTKSPTKSAQKEELKARMDRNKQTKQHLAAKFNKYAISGHNTAYDLERVAGLPAPHAAAAMNDISRLKGFALKQMPLLQSLDQAQRQPIFYAAAYGRVEAVEYLLRTLPDAGLGVQFGMQWVRGDVHGDTPLHGAAASGCAQCTELLLHTLTTYPSVLVDTGVTSVADLRNIMAMTPAHLASSAECLDVLYRYRADIEATDCHGRTPLFIACAMNREACAEYLIECLDHSVLVAAQPATTSSAHTDTTTAHPSAEDMLLRTDKRGDTPLHAAACNGAVECLLLLLQHGIDPRTKNLTGLKAIDLAVRNRHQKCKSILAEYHLHYCTSSEFDSVLFLATLEGHKKIAEQAARLNPGQVELDTYPASTAAKSTGGGSKTTGPIEEYRIIQSNPVESGSFACLPQVTTTGTTGTAATTVAPHKGKEMLQFHITADTQLGAKKDSFDNPFNLSPNSSAMHLNSATAAAAAAATVVNKTSIGTTSTGSGSLDEVNRTLHHATQSMFSLRTNKSMRLQKFGAWIAYHDTQSASVFWYNHETSEGQWQEPAQVTALKVKQATSETNNVFDKTLTAKMSMRMKRCCGDWIEYVTEAGLVFYYNDRDGSFQWEHPLGEAYARPQPQQQQEKKTAEYGQGTGIAQTDSHVEDSHYPWKAYLDPNSGHVFWYNEETFVSQWEMPEEFGAEGAAVAAATLAAASTGTTTSAAAATGRTGQHRIRDSLDLSEAAVYISNTTVVDDSAQNHTATGTTTTTAGSGSKGGGRRSRFMSSSFGEEEHEHTVAVISDHENELGI